MAAARDQSTVLTAWTGTLLRALADRGVDGAALAASVGIPPDTLDDPDRRVPLAASTRLWRAAVEATGDEALGLDVSRYVRPSTFHALGTAVLSSPTLSDAFDRIARYSKVTADVAVVTVERSEREITLVIGWRDGDRPASESIDAVLSTVVRSARYMLDRDASPRAVRLERRAPADTEPFARVFRCPLHFDAGEVQLVYDRSIADGAVLGGNADLARASDAVVSSYLATLEPDLTTRRVRTTLVDLLPGGEPDAAAVARALHTSTRTLQRELQSEGTTFREVLRDVRLDLADGYLRAGERTVTEITYLLGFSEPSTFSRAFRRWTGVSPSKYR